MSWPESRFLAEVEPIDGAGTRVDAERNAWRVFQAAAEITASPKPVVVYELVPAEAMDKIRAYVAGYDEINAEGWTGYKVLDALYEALPEEVKP